MSPTVYFQFPSIFDGTSSNKRILGSARQMLAVVIARGRHGDDAGGDVAIHGDVILEGLQFGRALPPRDHGRGSRTRGPADQLDSLVCRERLAISLYHHVQGANCRERESEMLGTGLGWYK